MIGATMMFPVLGESCVFDLGNDRYEIYFTQKTELSNATALMLLGGKAIVRNEAMIIAAADDDGTYAMYRSNDDDKYFLFMGNEC